MNIQKTIFELIAKEILPANFIGYKQLTGGTSSSLAVICYNANTKYVIKTNKPQIIEAEAYFLDYYRDLPLLPDLLYVAPAHQYIVYSFIQGINDYPKKNKAEMLKTLVQQLINHYKPAPNPKKWGWADTPTDSWENFLLGKVRDAKKVLHSILSEEDFHIVCQFVNDAKRQSFIDEPFLLHGDCGVHNFIFTKERLCGVIDPTPVYGLPLYDLIYAFCSSPDDLTFETIQYAIDAFRFAKPTDKILYEEIIIGLYLRIATCVKHHPHDLNEYLQAWDDWKCRI
jgi:Phosphotransferase enzyme family